MRPLIAAAVAMIPLLLARPAWAGPVDFECDVPPNRASSVDQAVPGPAVTISGRISFVLARGGRYSPMASVAVIGGWGSGGATLRMIGQPRSGANASSAASGARAAGAVAGGPPSAGDPFAVDILVRTAAGQRNVTLGTLPAATTDAPFSIVVGADGAASVSVGGLAARIMLAPLMAPRVRLLCSSGQFAFHAVEAR